MEEKRELSVRVGKAFYDFDVKTIEINGTFKRYITKSKLDRVFIFVYKNGNYEGVYTFAKTDNPVGNIFGSSKLSDNDSFSFKYEFTESGLYTFKIDAFTEDDAPYHAEHFFLGITFGQ